MPIISGNNKIANQTADKSNELEDNIALRTKGVRIGRGCDWGVHELDNRVRKEFVWTNQNVIPKDFG